MQLFLKVLESVKGAVVTTDVEAGAVVAGSPAKVIKMKDEKTADKTKLMEDLRNLD